jgi:hypothetical protein
MLNRFFLEMAYFELLKFQNAHRRGGASIRPICALRRFARSETSSLRSTTPGFRSDRRSQEIARILQPLHTVICLEEK